MIVGSGAVKYFRVQNIRLNLLILLLCADGASHANGYRRETGRRENCSPWQVVSLAERLAEREGYG